MAIGMILLRIKIHIIHVIENRVDDVYSQIQVSSVMSIKMVLIITMTVFGAVASLPSCVACTSSGQLKIFFEHTEEGKLSEF